MTRQGDRLFTTCGFPHDLHVGIPLQDVTQQLPHFWVIIHEGDCVHKDLVQEAYAVIPENLNPSEG
jgi:hypothetical protein